jgi:hypothetical protein
MTDLEVHILRTVSDDYESLDIIFGSLAKEGIDGCLDRNSVVEALRSLIQKGLVSAYHLSPKEPYSTLTALTDDAAYTLWYRATRSGLAVLSDC